MRRVPHGEVARGGADGADGRDELEIVAVDLPGQRGREGGVGRQVEEGSTRHEGREGGSVAVQGLDGECEFLRGEGEGNERVGVPVGGGGGRQLGQAGGEAGEGRGVGPVTGVPDELIVEWEGVAEGGEGFLKGVEALGAVELDLCYGYAEGSSAEGGKEATGEGEVKEELVLGGLDLGVRDNGAAEHTVLLVSKGEDFRLQLLGVVIRLDEIVNVHLDLGGEAAREVGDTGIGFAPCRQIRSAAGDDEQRQERILAAERDGRDSKGSAERCGSIVGFFSCCGDARPAGSLGCLFKHRLLKVEVSVQTPTLGVARLEPLDPLACRDGCAVAAQTGLVEELAVVPRCGQPCGLLYYTI